MVKGEAVQMVRCRKIKQGAYRTIAACKVCPEYGGVEQRPPLEDKAPPLLVVTCKLPTRVPVEHLIVEKNQHQHPAMSADEEAKGGN